MNKRYLALVAALMMIAASTSCAADNSSSENASSVVKNAASSAVNDDVPAPAAMDSAYKVLDCLDVPGIPSAIYSCGNLVAVQCRTVDGDGQNSIKYYIVDAEKDELIRTVDGGNSREILLGVDAEGGLIAEIWKDWVDASDEPQQLVSYKPDGTRTAEEYDGDMMFLKYDDSGQLFDLSNGVAKLGSDGSREVIFDSVEANETRSFDASKNRAAVSYLKESFTRATTLMLIDTSTGEEIAELESASDASVYSAGDCVVVSCVPDYEVQDVYTSVYEKETGKLLWTSSEKMEDSTFLY